MLRAEHHTGGFLNFASDSLKISIVRTELMDRFERELKRVEPAVNRLCRFALLGKKIVVAGKENFVINGPNIIVGNHIGTFKDIATVYKIVPRPIFFTANRMLFNKDEFNFLIKKHMRLQLKSLAPLLEFLIRPLKDYIVHYISTNITKVGTIPVDLYKKKRLAIRACQDYLKKGRAIIALQGHGRVIKTSLHPYVSSFKRGVSIISYNLFQEDKIEVPVTPMAMFGTQSPLFVPAKIKVNVGEPMYITDYIGNDFDESVNRFREALENRVKMLLSEVIRKPSR